MLYYVHKEIAVCSSSVNPKMEQPEEVTVELMQQILRKVENDNTITVLPCLQVDELNKDLHGGSCMSRVTVTYTKGGDQSQHMISLVVKVIPKIPSLTEVVSKSTMFPREIQMFDKILPRMAHLLRKAIPDNHYDFFAQMYYTRKSPSYFIAIEDLGPKCFKAPRRKNGLDLIHCQLVLKTLARFHAASVIIHNEDKNSFTLFNEYAFQEEIVNKTVIEIGFGIFAVVRKALESWPEFGPSWADRLRNRCKTLQEDLYAIWKRDENAFNVLNHGDFGLHNLMFRHSESGEVEAIMMVDFQCCSYNSPVLDIHQFLFSSAVDEVRAHHIEALLREYHAELTATLEALGAPKEQTISLPQLLQEFENKMLYAFFYTVCLLPLSSSDNDIGLSSDEIFSIGSDGLEKFMPFITATYAKTLKRLLPIFIQKNIL
ncbi:hypothetical protein PR048_018113 [Dryococelus australis]|uniref:CHK kinase-like domain-containing protein n=1 Tax=Dryococelus australis TaxID=614101 RepID=A0ABQ9HBC5_9NEOP|nr:hypothetical protein PR048_018113 [Dryococelus australis]